MVVGYGPIEDDEERERSWNYLDRVVDRVDNEYRLCVQGDLNGCVGDRMSVSINMS